MVETGLLDASWEIPASGIPTPASFAPLGLAAVPHIIASVEARPVQVPGREF